VREPLAVAAAQPRWAAHDVEANAHEHAVAVRSARARLVVFPELSLTGYELDAPAVDPADLRLAALREACTQTGTTALAGAVVSGGAGERSIGMLRVRPDGRVEVVYRKMWLGGDEVGRLRPGNTPAVIEVDGWRLGLAICKDTGVEQHASDTAALHIDAYVAGVCEHAADADADVQPGRIRRVIGSHQLWAVVAGFAGPTGGGFADTTGRSAVWAPTVTSSPKQGHSPARSSRPSSTLRKKPTSVP
jgi:predicted amidohydrolase